MLGQTKCMKYKEEAGRTILSSADFELYSEQAHAACVKAGTEGGE